MNYAIPERIALTLWVGGMWITGYLVAPMLFSVLEERALAGMLAGRMFSAMSYVGLVCVGLLLLTHFQKNWLNGWRQWRRWVLLAMLLVIVMGEFVLQPMMAELKALGLDEGSAAQQRFGMLHGLSSSLFLFNSLAGLVLVIFGLEPDTQRGS
ncbi:DUF4149 domain-containing protein [Thiohalophilus sp.]|uniref:DUF4149 domain-containing protein n=1 Tax=Thiohalophilus sp. TaxID=3028392 RepID=UPI002ACE27B4|nr:DUF4149 domain-containing protein [Thiohalophilus sp.]MDZ7662566.1 DUF4149 domain-containing protein [Thiohalophilus sp.]MDZ7802665.1 DUF4149 domain-containing protein [Thiohalophilus sp.]